MKAHKNYITGKKRLDDEFEYLEAARHPPCQVVHGQNARLLDEWPTMYILHIDSIHVASCVQRTLNVDVVGDSC